MLFYIAIAAILFALVYQPARQSFLIVVVPLVLALVAALIDISLRK
jgi:hypothetical protein